MQLLKYISISLLLIVAIVYSHFNFAPYQTMSGKIFGTYYSVKIKTTNKNSSIHNKIKQTLKLVNHQMSMFDANSEISKINKTAANQAIELSDSMSFLLQNANTIYQQSNGAFDPTVGNLVNLWGFGNTQVTKIPNDSQLQDALSHTGFNKLHFSNNFKQLQKKDSATYLDLSSIAKGYGVDKVSQLLENEGYHDYIIEIGGEVKASGQKHNQENWSIGIAKPSEQGNANAMVIDLTNYAVATSGDYRNFFYKDGKRFSHTISPQDGYPVAHNLASVTVFHSSCMLADAYATAIMSMGEKNGLAFANRYKLPVIMFLRHSDNSVTMQSSIAAKKIIGK